MGVWLIGIIGLALGVIIGWVAAYILKKTKV